MPMPNPVRLFHITAIANMAGICAQRALVSKNAIAQQAGAYINIAHQGAQGARAVRLVPNPPGGNIHDYVPFYYAPRSPMLSAIHNGKVANCTETQEDIVHFETTVERVLNHREPFVIYDRNATKLYSTPYFSINDLDKVAWDLITEAPALDGYCKYFFDRPTVERYADRMEKRMAEFLVRSHVPLTAMTRIGVFNRDKQLIVQKILQDHQLDIPVVIMPIWYF